MASIDINTTQNVTIEYELASVPQRMLAFLLDIVILIISTLLWITFVRSLLGNSLSNDRFLGVFLYSFVPLIGYFLYFLLFEGFTGQTIGKKAMRIKVIRMDGQEPSLSDFSIRTLFHLIDTLFSSGILAIALVSTSAKKQRIGDMAANTCVVKLDPNATFTLHDILKIDSLDNYEPVYPQVKILQEDDLLLVKNTIARYRKFQNQAHADALVTLKERIAELLDIKDYPKDALTFLSTILKDYIVLTR